MPNKRSSKTKTPRTGRPKGDALDVRTERFSFRLHPDLYDEVNKLARAQGLTHSWFIERAAIEKVHRDLKQPGLLDLVGRYADLTKAKAAAERRADEKAAHDAELSKPKRR